jgi:hypothetical protein
MDGTRKEDFYGASDWRELENRNAQTTGQGARERVGRA